MSSFPTGCGAGTSYRCLVENCLYPACTSAGREEPMTMTDPSAVERVAQSDRDAAANLIGKIGLSWSGDMIRDGKTDDHDYVQAFARHRRAAISAMPGGGVPEGWVIVPREPTLDMKRAGGLAVNADERVSLVTSFEAGMAYRAMLAAAPAPAEDRP